MRSSNLEDAICFAGAFTLPEGAGIVSELGDGGRFERSRPGSQAIGEPYIDAGIAINCRIDESPSEPGCGNREVHRIAWLRMAVIH